MRNAAIEAVMDMAKKDKDVILISADLGFGVFDHFRAEIPNQYFNVGVCEQNMSSLAAGLAMEGKKVYTYSIGNFPTLRCLEQIRNDICYHNVNVKIMAVGGGFAYGNLGMTHHATEDIAIMRSLPNMRVFTPADAVEVRAIVYKTAELQAPCYIRLNKGGEPAVHQSADELEGYQIGKALQLIDGNDICILSAGAVTIEAVRAAIELQKQGIGVAVYSFPTVKPIDRVTIKECSDKYNYILTIEEHNITGGFGSAVSEVFAEVISNARLIRIGLSDIYSSIVGSQAYLRHVYKMDCEAIMKKVEELLEA